MKEGENIEQAFVREMREETNMDVEMGRVLGSHIFKIDSFTEDTNYVHCLQRQSSLEKTSCSAKNI